MRRFRYVEPLGKMDEPLTITVSERWIRLRYWPYWKKQMRALGRHDLISFDNCIDDFVVVNWAEEL
jgi:hypothetical protein